MNKFEKKITGTSFKGYLYAKYDQLVSEFGEPKLLVSLDKKTDVTWIIETPYGIATIYNYKDGRAYLGETGLMIEQIYEWHVGAKSAESYEWVKAKLHSIMIADYAIVKN